MNRLVIGHKKSAASPKVVYFGDSGVECQKAIDANWEKFDLLEQAEIPVLRRARRSQHLITPKNDSGSSQAADAASLPPAVEQPAAGAEGPSLV